MTELLLQVAEAPEDNREYDIKRAAHMAHAANHVFNTDVAKDAAYVRMRELREQGISPESAAGIVRKDASKHIAEKALATGNFDSIDWAPVPNLRTDEQHGVSPSSMDNVDYEMFTVEKAEDIARQIKLGIDPEDEILSKKVPYGLERNNVMNREAENAGIQYDKQKANAERMLRIATDPKSRV